MSQVQQYWLPGYGLSRHIVLGHIQYFLGPSATVRPYTYQGRDGYLINGMPLTREQINDLAIMSREESEPYINEIVPVRAFGHRRQPVDHGGRRGR
ncbi:conserved hypothetical protein [Aspergillus lentulus]|uniref:Uncharacterized protein n=1 Tax=Aspergillus lentulus TaxID=293939 RepID=A0ABQ1ATR5_ASPLE|nr:conserved hypothetical protein [Aspergillus lentulus]GFF48075.1 conserved hypothetical protein [Aspergillus lentulus]GFF72537.1 conserved hypothetical protein [Aspergillus lentulus]GFF87941.1 conserved hypothetical protein [Aspergillus lentulus]